jgi:hypothetical protein
LALSGKLTVEIPDCMSEVIGQWIIVIQDAMPGDVRNSDRWKSLLPLAAGTGRVNEQERLDIILDWMWDIVLPSLQPLAGQHGFGEQWQKMTTERTFKAANAAAEEATWASRAAAGLSAAREAARAAVAAARNGASKGSQAAAAGTAAAAAAAETTWAAWATAWANFDPCGLLERLIGTRSPIKSSGTTPPRRGGDGRVRV